MKFNIRNRKNVTFNNIEIELKSNKKTHHYRDYDDYESNFN